MRTTTNPYKLMVHGYDSTKWALEVLKLWQVELNYQEQIHYMSDNNINPTKVEILKKKLLAITEQVDILFTKKPEEIEWAG